MIPAHGDSRYQQVTSISLDLHTMAQNLGITVVALSQLSRNSTKRTPGVEDLRDSGQIEQDADAILLLSLADQANPAGPRTLDIAKNKEGVCQSFTLYFDGNHQKFSSAESQAQARESRTNAKENTTQSKNALYSTWMPTITG